MRWLSIAWLLPACSSPPEEEVDAATGELEVELGSGSDGFAAIEPGDSLELIHGPQGGYHVLLAVRMRGADESAILISFSEQRLRDGLELTDPATIGASGEALAHDGGWSTLAGLLVILLPGLGPPDVVGEDLRSVVTVTDGLARTATASADFTVFYRGD